MALPPGSGPAEEPYHKMLRLREEAAGWEVLAHRALLEARKLEAKAARLTVKARKVADAAEAHAARARSLAPAGPGGLPDADANRAIGAEKARQLEFEAESLRQKAKGIESLAAQNRIAAQARLAESERHLQEAKRLALEADSLKGL